MADKSEEVKTDEPKVFRDEEDQDFILVEKGGQLRRKYLPTESRQHPPFRNLSELDVARALGDLPDSATSIDQRAALIAASKAIGK